MDTLSHNTRPVPSVQAGTSQPADISQARTTLLRPSRASGSAPSPAQQGIDRHTAEAKLWREQAEHLIEDLKQEMNRFARSVDRWQRLSRLAMRTPIEDAELTGIERELPQQGQRMARSRERWTACLVAARDHDDTAARLRTPPK